MHCTAFAHNFEASIQTQVAKYSENQNHFWVVNEPNLTTNLTFAQIGSNYGSLTYHSSNRTDEIFADRDIIIMLMVLIIRISAVNIRRAYTYTVVIWEATVGLAYFKN